MLNSRDIDRCLQSILNSKFSEVMPLLRQHVADLNTSGECGLTLFEALLLKCSGSDKDLADFIELVNQVEKEVLDTWLKRVFSSNRLPRALALQKDSGRGYYIGIGTKGVQRLPNDLFAPKVSDANVYNTVFMLLDSAIMVTDTRDLPACEHYNYLSAFDSMNKIVGVLIASFPCVLYRELSEELKQKIDPMLSAGSGQALSALLHSKEVMSYRISIAKLKEVAATDQKRCFTGKSYWSGLDLRKLFYLVGNIKRFQKGAINELAIQLILAGPGISALKRYIQDYPSSKDAIYDVVAKIDIGQLLKLCIAIMQREGWEADLEPLEYLDFFLNNRRPECVEISKGLILSLDKITDVDMLGYAKPIRSYFFIIVSSGPERRHRFMDVVDTHPELLDNPSIRSALTKPAIFPPEQQVKLNFEDTTGVYWIARDPVTRPRLMGWLEQHPEWLCNPEFLQAFSAVAPNDEEHPNGSIWKFFAQDAVIFDRLIALLRRTPEQLPAAFFQQPVSKVSICIADRIQAIMAESTEVDFNPYLTGLLRKSQLRVRAMTANPEDSVRRQRVKLS